MSRFVAVLLALSVLERLGDAQAPPAFASRAFDVTHYDIRLEPRLESRTVAGTVVLTLALRNQSVDAVTLNRGGLEIDAVEEQGTARSFVADGPFVRIALPKANGSGSRALTIRYHGAPKSGLVFVPEREQIYTLFSTSQWTIALDDPDARATLRLRVTIPKGWAAAGSGQEVSRGAISQHAEVVEWRQDRAVPTYTFGFVAGRFSLVTDRSPGATLRYLADGFSAADVRRVFADSAQMIAFFEERAGVAYPGPSYAQALVARTAGQEMAGLSLLSEEYGRAVLADPTAIGLIGHELAHQWWGNMVTCRGWTHFWLNEGMATYMAAAYRERRFGREAYLVDVASMRKRYEEVRDRGNDRPLVFPDWNRPTADDRTIVYQKGAYVLHQLRESIGDAAFWSGIRRYTQANFGKPVLTDDLRAAMEQASGKDLGGFFEEWVYRP